MFKPRRKVSTIEHDSVSTAQPLKQEMPSIEVQSTTMDRLKSADLKIQRLEMEIQRTQDFNAEESQYMNEELANRILEIHNIHQSIKEANQQVKEKNLIVRELENQLEILTEKIELDAAKQAEQEAQIAALAGELTPTTASETSIESKTKNQFADTNKEQNNSERALIKAQIAKLESELVIERERNYKTTNSAIVPSLFRSKSIFTAKRRAQSLSLSSHDLLEELDKLEQKYDMQRFLNAQLLTRMQSLQGNIQVCCRIRPPTKLEVDSQVVVEMLGETEAGFFDTRTKNWKSFIFDRVWGPEHTQEDIFQDIEPLSVSVVEGYNVCIFAYGQTGSGKTFTMIGSGDLGPYGLGISFRTLNKIFELLSLKEYQAEQQSLKDSRQHTTDVLLSENSDDSASYENHQRNLKLFSFQIKVAMLEIYNEDIRDLLYPRGTRVACGLEIRRENNDSLAQIPGLTFAEVTSVDDVVRLFEQGTQNRATSTTNMNEHSSRSHSVLIVDVETFVHGEKKTFGRLYLVDLAGSERVLKSGAEGQALKEAQHINKSLAALGDVMEALDQKTSHIPFRNSKLTHLLQDALGGNSRTMMVVTACPTLFNADETYFTLHFATRVRRITINPAQKNSNNKNLEEKMKALQQDLRRMLKKKELVEKELNDMKQDMKYSRQKAASLLEARVKTVDDLKKGLEAQISILKKSNDELLERLRFERESKDKLNEELSEGQRKLKQFERKKLNSEQEKNDLNQQLQKMAQEAAQLKRQVHKLRQQKGDGVHHRRSSHTSKEELLNPSNVNISAVQSPLIEDLIQQTRQQTKTEKEIDYLQENRTTSRNDEQYVEISSKRRLKKR